MSRVTPLHAWIAGAALAWATSTQAAEGVSLPPVHRAQLANGAQVALVEKRDTPLVAMTVTRINGDILSIHANFKSRLRARHKYRQLCPGD